MNPTYPIHLNSARWRVRNSIQTPIASLIIFGHKTDRRDEPSHTKEQPQRIAGDSANAGDYPDALGCFGGR